MESEVVASITIRHLACAYRCLQVMPLPAPELLLDNQRSDLILQQCSAAVTGAVSLAPLVESLR